MNALVAPDLSIEQFEAGALDPGLFDHEAHVYVAWLYVQRYDLSVAIPRFCAALRRLVTQVGAEGKYHATITWFFLLLVAERSKTREPWLSFRSRNLDIVTGGKGVLARYYTQENLSSERARCQFVLPDNLSKSANTLARKAPRSDHPS